MSAAFSSPQVWAFPVTAVGRACRGFPFLVPSQPVGCRVPAALVCSVFKRGGGAACPSRCDSLTFVCHHISAGQTQERALILRAHWEDRRSGFTSRLVMFGPREGVPKMSHSGITMALS